MKKTLMILCLIAVFAFPSSYCCSESENLNDFKYSVSEGGLDENYDFYNTIKGIETINNPEKSYNLRIVSKENIEKYGNEQQKKSLKLLNDLLDGKEIVNYEKYNFDNKLFNINSNVNTLFHDGFPDWGSDISGEISNVDSGDFDKMSAYYTIDGQNPPFGEITVVVYAQKGYYYYMFDAPTGISTEDKEGLANPAFNNCLDQYGYEDEARQCFVKSLKDNQEVQKTLTDKANELVKSFPEEIIDSEEARSLLKK